MQVIRAGLIVGLYRIDHHYVVAVRIVIIIPVGIGVPGIVIAIEVGVVRIVIVIERRPPAVADLHSQVTVITVVLFALVLTVVSLLYANVFILGSCR